MLGALFERPRGLFEPPPRAITLSLALTASTVLIWSLALMFTRGVFQPASTTMSDCGAPPGPFSPPPPHCSALFRASGGPSTLAGLVVGKETF
jgi:hypothetical protein